MLSYKMDFSPCGIAPGFGKSSHIYIFRFGGAAVSWKSIKQTTVALSTAEAEYIALSTAGFSN